MRWMLSIVSTLLVFVAQATAAQLPVQEVAYSADRVVEFGEDRLTGKSYHDAGRERHELSIDGLDQITILRPDLDRAFVIQPTADSLIELSIEEVAILPPLMALYTYQATRVGSEVVHGEETTRYRLTNPKSLFGPPEVMVWITDDGVVIQMEGVIDVDGEPERVILVQRNVVRGEQDPVLFDPLLKKISDDVPVLPDPPGASESD